MEDTESLKIGAVVLKHSRAPVLKVYKRGGWFADSSSCDSNPKSSAGLSPSSFKEVQVKSTERFVSSSLVSSSLVSSLFGDVLVLNNTDSAYS